jgi:hypothetical protein
MLTFRSWEGAEYGEDIARYSQETTDESEETTRCSQVISNNCHGIVAMRSQETGNESGYEGYYMDFQV